MKIVCIRDIKADLWFNPNYIPSLGGAIREFGDACINSEGPLSKHPADYELYDLGEWDEQTGKFKLLDQPKQLAVGSNFSK